MKPRKTKQNKLKVTYTYTQPASEEERREAERRLERAYDILFTEMLKGGQFKRWLKKIVAGWGK